MADAIGQDQVEAARVEHAAGAEQLAGEFGPDELTARAAGAVQDQHRIEHLALRVAPRRAQRAVMQLQLWQDLAASEAEVLRDVVAFNGRRVVGGTDLAQTEPQDQQAGR